MMHPIQQLEIDEKKKLDARIRELITNSVADAKRLDWLEQIIRDGSWQSFMNDIVAVCQLSYKTFGKGPALRSAIDGVANL